MKVATCSACLYPFGVEQFSKNQWYKRKEDKQRCPSCVENKRYTVPVMETMMILQHLPPCLRARVLELANTQKDDPLPPLLLGMITSADAFAEYSGMDVKEFIMSPQFADVVKEYEEAIKPSIRAQAKIVEQAEAIRRLEERLSHLQQDYDDLEHDYDDLETRHANTKSRCTHRRRLFEQELLGSEYFFRRTAKMMKALLRISQRSETRNDGHVPLGQHYRNRDAQRPNWEQAIVQGARDHISLRLPVMRPIWRMERETRVICIHCSSRTMGLQPIRNCGCVVHELV